ncbi:MAG: 16S rRNA (cytosine(967)-C(5))-methyltransferase RsmB [Burkholderiaceae bacterium]|nr:16S rRNA (cytosine(967)-C(5))-methyltransferase RsmB [Burkholderiaceae bacterium]
MPVGAPLSEVLRAAAPVWVRVHTGQALDRALELQRHESAASNPLRSAVRDVCHGAMRHRALIDALLQRLAARAPEPEIGGLLAVALSQLLDDAYGEHVLVDQAVQAARNQPQMRAAAGFVNAVLRSFLRRREQLLPELLLDDATRLNVPPWWLQRVRHDHPDRWEGVLASAAAEPPLVLRVNCRRGDINGYLALLREQSIAATRVGPSAVRLQRPLPVARIPGFAQGLVSVQDAAAQLAAPWLQPSDADRVLDACAAPGGKTGHLAELSDANIDAVEVDPVRARLVAENLLRLGLEQSRVRVLVADAGDPAAYWDGHPYDRILLDAPCTASGIVRRHPDIPWLRRETDVAQLATNQARLLDAVWPLLAPAGRLLYVVCSVFRQEAHEQADSFLERHPDARAVALPGAPGRWCQLLPTAGADAGHAACLPSDLPTDHDGFFFALLEKKVPSC